MKKKIKILNNRGFSLVEIIVAMGLIAIVAVGSVSLMTMDSKSEKVVDKRSGTMMFLGGIGKYFNTGFGCAELIGETVEAFNTDFTIDNYDGFGANDGGVGTAQTIDPGFEILKEFSIIESLQFRRKPPYVPALPEVPIPALLVDKFVDQVAKKEQILQIAIGVRSAARGKKLINPLVDGNVRQYFFEIPVVTNTLNVIESCSVGMSPDEICSALQLVHNPATGLCQAGAGGACIFKGTYITMSCNSGVHPCDPSWTVAPTMDNPFTGAASCPINSTAVQTGNYQSERPVSCGKKCSVNVITTENYYTCLDCP
jgi:prepilin-type N-terminal cleavage/methylation domain-containing protein